MNNQIFYFIEKFFSLLQIDLMRHYRGLIQALRKAYKAALNDLTITINLDEKFCYAYQNSAYYVQKYQEFKLADNKNYITIGNLLLLLVHLKMQYNLIQIQQIQKKVYKFFIIELKHIFQLKNLIVQCKIYKKQFIDILAIVDLNVLQQLKYTSANHGELNLFQEALQCANSIIKKGVEGKIFKRSDILFYKGMFHFYLKQYEQAQQSLRESYEIKEEQQSKYESSMNDSDQFILEALNQTQKTQKVKAKKLEEFEFIDRTYNLFEYLFNMSGIDLLLGNTESAVESLQLLNENIKQKEIQEHLFLFIELIQDDLNPKTELNPDFSKLSEFIIFPQHNRLCSIYPTIKLPKKKYKQSLQLRLSFCLPTIEIPEMTMKFDDKLLESINPTVVENKPDMDQKNFRRSGFTDNVQIVEDLDLKLTTRPKETVLDDPEFQQFEEQLNYAIEKYDYSEIDQQNDIVEQQPSIDLRQLKQELMLDSKIADKLNSILKIQLIKKIKYNWKIHYQCPNVKLQFKNKNRKMIIQFSHQFFSLFF